MLFGDRKEQAEVLLCINAQELWSDRIFQAALHLYLERVHLWYREDIDDNTRQKDREERVNAILMIDEHFFSKVSVQWQDARSFSLRSERGQIGVGVSAAVEEDPSCFYYFGMGSPIDWHIWLRPEDCVPSGLYQLNRGHGVREVALATLKAENPNTPIRTIEQLNYQIRRNNLAAVRAVGTHEAGLTKPLRRCKNESGAHEEVYSMHTNQWYPTEYMLQYPQGY